jgi:hypothetical protein
MTNDEVVAMRTFVVDRWKRFSLRTLFVLMTAFCLLFGMWAVYVNPYRMQQRSLAVVNRLQGDSLSEPAEGPGWHRWLVTTMLGDEAFVHVTAVNLAGRKVDDKTLRSLADLIYCQHLALDYTKITDDGVAYLRSMRDLERVSLRFTDVTDRGAEYLVSLPKLTHALLMGTKISDAAVPILARNKNAKEIFIRWTRISNEGAERLRAALPDCQVFHHALVMEHVTN